MDVTDRDDGDTGHGDDEFAVLLDALDVAFGAFVDAVGHAHAVARVVFRRVGTEVLDVAACVGGGHQDERAHLRVADGAGGLLPGLRVVHEILVVALLEINQPALLAAHEHQRGDQLLLDVGQAAGLEVLDRVDRDISLHARCFEQGLHVNDAVVEHLERVPAQAFRGGVDKVECHGGVHFFHSPALRRRSAGKSRIWRDRPRAAAVLLSKSRCCKSFFLRAIQSWTAYKACKDTKKMGYHQI